MSNKEYETRTTSVTVSCVNGRRPPLEKEFTVELAVHGDGYIDGESVEVVQSETHDVGGGGIVIHPDEWPTLRVAIDFLISKCRRWPEPTNVSHGNASHADAASSEQ